MKNLLSVAAFLITAPVIVLVTSSGWTASSPTRVTIHVPSKSLSIMPYYFGKDKGFFAPELVEPQLVMMSPPTAIAALVAGELDFSSTTGAATSAIMRGLPLRRYFYVQAEPSHVLLAQPEIKSIQDLNGKTIGVTALTDAVGMSTTMILKGNNIDISRTTQLAMGVTDNAIKAFTTRKIAATLLAPPYAEELEAKGYNKLAEARAYAPLSFIGLVSSTETVKKNPLKVQAMIAGLYRTMIYIHNPVNRNEVIQYIARYHGIDLALAKKSLWDADAIVQQRRHEAAEGGGAGNRDLSRHTESPQAIHAGRFGRYEFAQKSSGRNCQSRKVRDGDHACPEIASENKSYQTAAATILTSVSQGLAADAAGAMPIGEQWREPLARIARHWPS
jgi:ABC-type nitrate/sulfonate/bicarbonate transport system substrate-binding protein